MLRGHFGGTLVFVDVDDSECNFDLHRFGFQKVKRL